MKKTGITRIFYAFKYSYEGFVALVKSEAAFRQELLATLILIPLAFYVNVSTEMRAILIVSNMIVLIVEVLNSAIEAIVDKTSPEHNQLAKVAKDAGSLAVLLAIINLIIIWVINLI